MNANGKRLPDVPPAEKEASSPVDLDPLGAALRNAYRQAVEEPVPDEILDLLAKLR